MPDTLIESANIEERLKKWKRQLIDLTRRNRLLNYRPTKLGSVEVVDELPQQVLLQLLAGQSFCFDPRPEKPEGAREQEANFTSRATLSAGGFFSHGRAERNASLTRDHSSGREIVRTAGKQFAEHHTDDRLQTKHSEKSLDRKLLHLFRTAESALEEQGVNILFLALGMLEWHKSNDSDIVNRAPLLLIPAWIARRDAASPFRLERGDEETLLNPALVENLHLDFSLKLPEIPELTDDLDVDELFFSVKDAVSGFERWRVTSDIALGLFDFRKFVMYRDLERYAAKLSRHSVIRAMCGELEKNAFGDLPQDVREANLDKAMSPWSTIQVTEADSSQQRAILAVRQGHHLVIEGPPGTGKSQTITNLIADALATGKSVLFVSEKMAALKVVKSRLEGVGLGEFCLELHSHHTKKTEFVHELARSLDVRWPETEAHDKELGELEHLTRNLKSYVVALHKPFGALKMKPFDAIAQLADLEGSPVVRTEFPGCLDVSEEEYQTAVGALRHLARTLDEVGQPAAHPLRGCRLTETTRTAQRNLEEAASVAVRAMRRLADNAESFAGELGIQKLKSFGDVELAIELAEVLARSPGTEISVLKDPGWNKLPTEVHTMLATGREYMALMERTLERFHARILDEDLEPRIAAFQGHLGSGLRFLKPEYWKIRSYLRSFRLPDYRSGGIAGFVSDLKQAIACRRCRFKIREWDDEASKLFADRWRGESSDWAQLQLVAEWIVDFRRYAALEFLQAKGFQLAAEAAANPAGIQQQAEELRQSLKTARESILHLVEAGRFVAEGELASDASATIQALLERVSEIRCHLENLRAWALYRVARDRCELGITSTYVANALEEKVEPNQFVPSFERAFLEAWLDEVCCSRSVLGEFRASEHESRIEKFQELDAASHRFARLRARHAVLERRNRELLRTEYSGQLQRVQREAKKKTRILPIRKLLRLAPDVITLIKPCFMMSPLSVAWHLDADRLKFDLLVFDEASQIPPADAVGAIMRASQIVVVGDSKQLPPTNFFSAQLEPEEPSDREEETPCLEDLESILDEVATSGVPKVRLKWHYRSEHESLIRFSNEEYYSDDPLYTFPNAASGRSENGLQFEHVKGGIYEGGGRNCVEARRVVEAVAQHVRKCPHLTLGVGTFGVAQRILILDGLDRERRSDPSIEFFFQQKGEKRFFVNNLENIQGHDRDVIFLSVTYGPGKDGRVRRNFGPINNEGGWRRLNVITTRAKKRLCIFSSMRADEIDLGGGLARGARDLSRFLRYAETKEYPTTSLPPAQPASKFEIAVKRELEKRGYQVIPQVGEAGYRIDLGVLDPELPGRFICGIECDGASYHSAQTVRDRDRLRQQVLEDRGWDIHRVWSTDWFHDRAGQVERMLALIEASRSRQKEGTRNPQTQSPVAAVVKAPTSLATPEENLPDKTEISAIPVEPYRFAEPLQTRKPEDFYLASLQRIEEDCLRVARVEAPIHREELTRRVAGFWGLARAADRIKKKVEDALSLLGRKARIQMRRDFVWLPEKRNPPVRSRDIDGVTFRADQIAPGEAVAAIKLLLTYRAPLLPDEIAPETAKLLGFHRTGNQLKSLIESAVQRLIKAGELEVCGLGIQLKEVRQRLKPNELRPQSGTPAQAAALAGQKSYRNTVERPLVPRTLEKPRNGAAKEKDRPLFNLSILELERLASRESSNSLVLRQVAQELRFRSTDRARALAQRTFRLLGRKN